MASYSRPAGSVSVEVVADPSRLDAGLGQAQTRAAGSQIADDLGKVESAAKGAGVASARGTYSFYTYYRNLLTHPHP